MRTLSRYMSNTSTRMLERTKATMSQTFNDLGKLTKRKPTALDDRR